MITPDKHEQASEYLINKIGAQYLGNTQNASQFACGTPYLAVESMKYLNQIGFKACIDPSDPRMILVRE